jgi:hypothetical protein
VYWAKDTADRENGVNVVATEQIIQRNETKFSIIIPSISRQPLINLYEANYGILLHCLVTYKKQCKASKVGIDTGATVSKKQR